MDGIKYKVRLITLNELVNDFYITCPASGTTCNKDYNKTPKWIYINGVSYWTMSPDTINDNSNVWVVYSDLNRVLSWKTYYSVSVRPVINLLKSAISQ